MSRNFIRFHFDPEKACEEKLPRYPKAPAELGETGLRPALANTPARLRLGALPAGFAAAVADGLLGRAVPRSSRTLRHLADDAAHHCSKISISALFLNSAIWIASSFFDSSPWR